MHNSEVGGADAPVNGVRLSIGSRENLTDELIDRVNRACAEAEDALAGVIIVHLRTDGDGRGPWPGKVGVHTVNQWERALRRLERCPSATVTYADGACSGAAAEALLATDYRIVGTNFVFRLSSDRWRPWPGTALYRLVSQIGLARARRLALFGEDLSAATAREWNVVDEVHRRGSDLAAHADAAAARCAGMSGSELAIRRRLLYDALATSFEDALGAHLAACERTLRGTPDTDAVDPARGVPAARSTADPT